MTLNHSTWLGIARNSVPVTLSDWGFFSLRTKWLCQWLTFWTCSWAVVWSCSRRIGPRAISFRFVSATQASSASAACSYWQTYWRKWIHYSQCLPSKNSNLFNTDRPRFFSNAVYISQSKAQIGENFIKVTNPRCRQFSIDYISTNMSRSYSNVFGKTLQNPVNGSIARNNNGN